MFRRLLVVSGLVLALILAVAAYSVFRTPEEASSPIQAIPIAETSTTAAAPTTVSAAPTTASTTDTQATAPAAGATTVSSNQIFEIVAAESEARFLIDEVLRGSPFTVVGATDQVAGQIALDPSSPASVQLGTIQVNARTLVTDNDFRNRAIKNAILSTDTYEFVTFTPTAISGLPETVTVGEPFSFQITGDLTVKNTTRTVTFEATVTPLSETELSGTASTRVLHRDFGLTIPDSPMVDTVADEVRIEIDFVARPVVG
jgi:polyisoprenoid-binding protein YceI